MGTNHLRSAFQRALILAQVAEDQAHLGVLVRTGWVGTAETKTLCVACGDDLDVGQRYEKAFYPRRPRWERYVHERCPATQGLIDELRRGQHQDLVMHSFVGRGGGVCERCGARFARDQVIHEVRALGALPLEGKIYERCCKECVSVFN